MFVSLSVEPPPSGDLADVIISLWECGDELGESLFGGWSASEHGRDVIVTIMETDGVPEAVQFAASMSRLLEQVESVIDGIAGYRAKLREAGFGPGVAAAKLIFTMSDSTGNIWITKIEAPR